MVLLLNQTGPPRDAGGARARHRAVAGAPRAPPRRRRRARRSTPSRAAGCRRALLWERVRDVAARGPPRRSSTRGSRAGAASRPRSSAASADALAALLAVRGERRRADPRRRAPRAAPRRGRARPPPPRGGGRRERAPHRAPRARRRGRGGAAHRARRRDGAREPPAPSWLRTVWGGLVGGAVGGVAADLATGGFTLGGGALVGAILGAAGGRGLAFGMELLRSDEAPRAAWSAPSSSASRPTPCWVTSRSRTSGAARGGSACATTRDVPRRRGARRRLAPRGTPRRVPALCGPGAGGAARSERTPRGGARRGGARRAARALPRGRRRPRLNETVVQRTNALRSADTGQREPLAEAALDRFREARAAPQRRGPRAPSPSAASRADAMRRASRRRSAMRRSGRRPCWRVPRNSPGPRMRRSASAIAEAVLGLEQRAQPRLAVLGRRRARRGGRCRGRAPRPDAAAELVELREAEALGVLDDHQRRVRHVDADLDHRRRDQDARLARLEARHRRAARVGGVEAAVHEVDARRPANARGDALRGLASRRAGPSARSPRRAGRRRRPARRARASSRSVLHHARALAGRSTSVATGARPGGSSSITETSRSP